MAAQEGFPTPMRVITDLGEAELERDSILTVGIFDGVHLGHRHLIEGMVKRAREKALLAGAVTFDPHPHEILLPHESILYLNTLEERIRLLGALGLDFLVVISFTPQVACTTAEAFIRSLHDHLRPREIWVGQGFVFGYRREGDVSQLKVLGSKLGFEVHLVEPLRVRGEPVSSSKIRALISEGRIEEATGSLGRYPTVTGRVIVGAGRGKELGFPTANLDVPEKRVIPADGVYVVRVQWGAENHPALANVGTRPTFGEGKRLVEAHILDFEGHLYGEELRLEFIARLRPERRFASVEELVSQMYLDVSRARKILGQERNPMAGPEARRYEEVEHTADAAIRAFGRDLPELFANAAYGMFDLLADMGELGPTIEREVSLEASDLEALLVDWLGELLYLREAHDEVYKEFELSTLSPTELRAVVKGGKRFVPRMGIKAVTYHDLKIEKMEEGYAASIVFDV
ncbi:MAG: bifunctional riboflavin kinase/FAD synthetase [Anaerolineae bacterium]